MSASCSALDLVGAVVDVLGVDLRQPALDGGRGVGTRVGVAPRGLVDERAVAIAVAHLDLAPVAVVLLAQLALLDLLGHAGVLLGEPLQVPLERAARLLLGLAVEALELPAQPLDGAVRRLITS